MSLIEISGLVATILVFVSFIPKNIKFIRWANLIGSIFFVIYGFGIGAFFTGLMNSGLILVQTYHLIKIYKGEIYAGKNKQPQRKKASKTTK